MVRKHGLLSAILLLMLSLTACGKTGIDDGLLRVGHTGGNLSAAVYAADLTAGLTADIRQFRSSSDIAYALLSASLDIGFVDSDRLAAFSRLDGFGHLTVAGAVTYPYGATLILRKGLNVRLQELNGLNIAVSAPNCSLLETFEADARRLGGDLSGVTYSYMAFDAMLPALEAGVIDAAVIKGIYAVVALHEGSTILYQNWDVEPGDECCPAIIDQAALVLLVRRDRLEAAQPFIDAMAATRDLSYDELRRAVADNTVIPFELLKGQPVPEFVLADDGLTATLFKHEHRDKRRT